MLQFDDLLLDFLDEVVEPSHVVTSLFVFACHVLAECDGALVVHVEGRGLELFEAEFFENFAKVNDVLGAFDGCVYFGFGGAESDHFLLLASGMEYAGVLPESEVDPGMGLGIGVSEEGGVGACDELSDGLALAGVLRVVYEFQVGGGVEVIGNLAEAFVIFESGRAGPGCQPVDGVGDVGACAKDVYEHTEEGCVFFLACWW